MRLQVKGKNVEVTDSIREYAEEKLSKLERQLADPTRVELELAVERNPSISQNHVAEATVWTKGPVLRARETSPDMRASIDQLVDKLERQGHIRRAQDSADRRRRVVSVTPEGRTAFAQIASSGMDLEMVDERVAEHCDLGDFRAALVALLEPGQADR